MVFHFRRKQRTISAFKPSDGTKSMRLLYGLVKLALFMVVIWPLSAHAVQPDDLSLDQQPSIIEENPCLDSQTCYTAPDGEIWCKKKPNANTDKSFRDCPHCPEMVRLSSRISIGQYEVTQGQWRAIAGSNPSQFTGCDNCPVEQVSWDEVQEYIKRLNQSTGKHYRLPTEKEWSMACQSGSRHKYCGSDNIDAVAWHEGNSGGRTHQVGGKQANAFGVYDMSGNVAEWTTGCCNKDCSCRTFLGGAWDSQEPNLRGDAKAGFGAMAKLLAVGFRLIRDN
jgi:hypothetical protein